MLGFFGVSVGLREAIIGLIGLVAAYMLFVLLRMRRLQSRRDSLPLATVAEPVLVPQPQEPAVAPMPEPPPETVSSGLASEILYQGLEREVGQLRQEVDAVRSELAALRRDLEQEVLQVRSQVRAAQNVSPLYSDAMQMAMAGYTAAMIAERCGIARAEAEMVVGLVRTQQGEQNHG